MKPVFLELTRRTACWLWNHSKVDLLFSQPPVFGFGIFGTAVVSSPSASHSCSTQNPSPKNHHNFRTHIFLDQQRSVRFQFHTLHKAFYKKCSTGPRLWNFPGRGPVGHRDRAPGLKGSEVRSESADAACTLLARLDSGPQPAPAAAATRRAALPVPGCPLPGTGSPVTETVNAATEPESRSDASRIILSSTWPGNGTPGGLARAACRDQARIRQASASTRARAAPARARSRPGSGPSRSSQVRPCRAVPHNPPPRA